MIKLEDFRNVCLTNDPMFDRSVKHATILKIGITITCMTIRIFRPLRQTFFESGKENERANTKIVVTCVPFLFLFLKSRHQEFRQESVFGSV